MRIEKDSLGEMQIPDDVLYGVHSLRSLNNFPQSGEKINPYLIKAYSRSNLLLQKQIISAVYFSKKNLMQSKKLSEN